MHPEIVVMCDFFGLKYHRDDASASILTGFDPVGNFFATKAEKAHSDIVVYF